jgi:hypothetical protein
MVLRLGKIWKKTEDVERIHRRPGRPFKMEHVLKQAVVQIFIDYVDITITEALEWLKEEFKIALCRDIINNILSKNNVSYKRLKFLTA